MKRLLIAMAPLLTRLAPRSPVTLRADWLRHLSRLEEAVEKKRFERIDRMLDDCRTIAEQLAPHDPSAAAHFNLLGDCYHDVAGRNREAEEAYRRAVELAEQQAKDSATLCTSLNNLALLLLRQSRAPEAETVLRRLLRVIESVHGRRHPEYATALVNLAAALRQLDRTDEAREVRAEAASLDPTG